VHAVHRSISHFDELGAAIGVRFAVHSTSKCAGGSSPSASSPAVASLRQRPPKGEPERKKFKKLPVRLVEFLQMADSQDYLILLSRDLTNERLICGPAITRQVFERFGDRSRRPGKVEENANGLDIHLCRDVQPEQRIVRLCRSQLEEPILGSDRQADIILR
jgi:hypothetical protein